MGAAIEVKQQRSTAGKTTGSFFNWMMGNNKTLPEVGKGATMLSWTDRHAYEVMAVSENGKEVTLRQYIPERTDSLGMSDAQSYKYEKMEEYEIKVVWKWGAWRRVSTEVRWIPEFYASIENNPELRREASDKVCPEGDLIVVEGMTARHTIYSKINILFGVKQEYYDYSF